MAEYMSLGFLTESEKGCAASTRQNLSGFYDNFPLAIDILLKLPYFIEHTEPPDSQGNWLHVFCYDGYLQAPYTFLCTYRLCIKGHYLESFVLIRHTLETLLQMRYFHKYPEGLRKHLMDNKRVSFKKMFDELCPGFYKEVYGGILSNIAHGKQLKTVFRTKRSSPTEGEVLRGCEFNQTHALFVINHVTILAYGYCNLFGVFFPENRLSVDEEVRTGLSESKEWLEATMKNVPLADYLKDLVKIPTET